MKTDCADTNILLDKQTDIALYRSMLAIRMVEQKISDVYPTDKIQSPIHLSIGQEAVAAGVCKAMGPKDRIYGTYRGHGIFVAKGGDLNELFAELYGKDAGCARGKGGSMHLVAPELGLMGCSAIVASTIPIATGHALASKMNGGGVVIAFFGDGALGEGVFYESVNFACLKKLPIIYVCENNNYAVHSRVSDRHQQTELYRMPPGLGIAGRRFDGNNVRVVYSSMTDAIREVNETGAPLFLEYMTYRMREHVGFSSDHAETYREKDKLLSALRNDPLKAQKAVLQRQHAVSPETFLEWDRSIAQAIADAVAFAEASPFPGPEQLQTDIFQEIG